MTKRCITPIRTPNNQIRQCPNDADHCEEHSWQLCANERIKCGNPVQGKILCESCEKEE